MPSKNIIPRPAVEVAILIPALAPTLRALGGEYAVAVAVDDEGMDVGRVEELFEDVGVDVGVDVDVGTNGEGVEDGVMLLLMDEIADDDVAELDSTCLAKDSGEGA